MGNCCSGPTTVLSPTLTARPLRPQETTQSTPLASIPSSTVPDPASSVTLSSGDSYGTPAHGTASHNDEMSPTPARVPSQDSASSQGPFNSGGYPPSPSRGDAPASQHSHLAETRSYQYRSRGSASPQLNKSVSVDTRLPQDAPLHSSSRMNRAASASLLDYGHPPAGTQLGSRPTPETGQMPAERHEGRPRFRSTLQSQLSDDFRFKILVVGKPESGKSSLINDVYKVDMSKATPMNASPTNASPRVAEFRPHDNRHLMAYECSGFGAGDLQVIRDFVMTRNHKSRSASERLHAIW
jgi:hypothetical protein